MLMKEEREKIVYYCNKLICADLTKGTGGNISIYNRKENKMTISPSGIEYNKMNIDDVVVMDLKGNILDSDKKPSSEYLLHKIFYERRNDIYSVVHTHSIYSCTLACLNWNLPATHYMIALAGKDVKCAKYATFGSNELAVNAFEAMKDRNAVLLANHGLLTGAKNIENAFNIAEEIEFCAEVYYRAKSIGDPVILSNSEMDVMLDKFKSYGQISK